MGCLSITLTPAAPRPVLTIETRPRASLTLHDGQGNPPRKTTSLVLSPTPSATLVLTTHQHATLTLTPRRRASLVIGEVCSISDGELMVLAASDGPLRFSNGDFWLLDPARESGDSSDNLIDINV